MNSLVKKNFYCISSRVEKTDQLYGCFKIGPFFDSQSLTFANTLRRTLLADKSKCTFNAIQIYGVEHEFSNMVGIRESVLDLLINLEKLIFSTTKPVTKPQVAFVHFEGPGILRAHHIHLPPNLKLVVPYQYISTLEVDGKLTFKLFFSPAWEKFQPFFSKFDIKKKTNLNNLILNKLLFKKRYINFLLPYKKSINNLNLFSNNILSYIVYPFYNIKTLKFFINKTGFSFIKNLNFINKFNLEKKNIFSKKKINNLKSLKKKKLYIYKNKKYKLDFSFNFLKSIKIEENFLFLESPKCSVERVNYTLQSSQKNINLEEFKNSDFLLQQLEKNLEIKNKLERPLKKKNLDLKYDFQLSNFFGLEISENDNFKNSELKIKKETILSNRISNSSEKKSTQISHIEEYIILEVWTNCSLHPQTAIFKAIKNILLDILPYSLLILKQQKMDSVKSKTLLHKYFKLQKKKSVINISKSVFKEKLLNLEINNFYFDLETFIFLKKNKIHRMIDLLKFLKKQDNKKSLNINSNFFLTNFDSLKKKKIEKTLHKFKLFINSL